MATEVKRFQVQVDAENNAVVAQQKEIEQMLKLVLPFITGIAGLILLVIILYWAKEILNQRFLNVQLVESLRSQNQQLHQENDSLNSELEKFKQFQVERSNLENLKRENEVLKKRNSNLNDRLIQCKKPFWERNCN
ncbi:hypothetical protein [Nostoc sp. MG11]|uniref:hypothetical protein n=1 Tax=Nostoc sp. MG11 TaxID=2721166 RepID=UPI001867462E|nr:hypothetical protein [Nostoc sp. MG11]